MSETSDTLAASAKELQRRGKPEAAAKIWEHLVREGEFNPRSAKIQFARCRLLSGDPHGAMQIIAKIPQRARQDEGIDDLTLKTRLECGEAALLKEELELSLINNSQDVAAKCKLAAVFQFQGDLASAAECLKNTELADARIGLIQRYRLALQIAREGNLELAENLLFASYELERLPEDVVFRRALLRSKLGIPDRETFALFDHVIKMSDKFGPDALLAKLEFQWEFGAAAKDLLGELERYETTQLLPLGGDLDELRIALILEAGNFEDMEHLLRIDSRYLRYYDRVLPLAAYLSERGRQTETMLPYAQLCGSLNDTIDDQMRTCFPMTRTLAVVGNSPCELGRGRGNEIDTHDAVARFNNFSVDPKFAPDYGMKTTVLVRVPGPLGEKTENAMTSGVVLFSGRNLRYRWREWDIPLGYMRKGIQVCAIPTAVHAELIPALGASPSSGLAFASLLKQLKTSIARSDFYGFAFVDQTGGSATSSHYFEQSRAVHRHQWERELREFEKLFN